MKNKLILLLLMSFYGSQLMAAQLTCSINGTEILFVNGVDNTLKDIDNSLHSLERHFELIPFDVDKKMIVGIDFSYNHTVNENLDFLEAGAQSIESMSNGSITFETAFVNLYKLFFNLPHTDSLDTSVVNTYYLENREKINQLVELEKQDVSLLADKIKKKIDLHRKVLIVSHSQGNFFANKALLQLIERPDFDYEKYKGIIGNIRVASPESRVIASNSALVQNSADAILKVPGSPYPNYILYVPDPAWDIRTNEQDKKDNHSFVETYMFDLAQFGDDAYNENQSLVGLRKRTIKAITDTAAKLKPHPLCPYCTDTYLKRDYELERRLNSDGTLGGYVSKEAYVEQNVYLSPDSIVCGEAVIADSAKVLDEAVVEGTATIFGNAIISGKAIVSDDALVGGYSHIDGNSVVLDKSYVLDNAKISDEAMILNNSRILGFSKISGAATVADSVMTNGSTSISGTAIVKGSTMVLDQALIGESAFVSASAVSGKAAVTGNASVFNFGYVSGGIVRGDAVIIDNGRVSGSATVEGLTLINGSSGVIDNAVVKDNALVLDAGLVWEQGRVEGNAVVRGYSDVAGQAILSDHAILHDSSIISGTSKVYEYAQLFGNFAIWGNAEAFGNAKLEGYGNLTGNAKAYDNSFVSNSNLHDNSRIFGNAKVMNWVVMSENSYARDNAQVTGYVWLRGTTGVIGDSLVCGSQQIWDTLISGSGHCY